MSFHSHPASYRDPAGFIFEKDHVLYRQVNQVFREDFDHFLRSGCYHHLVQEQWLIPHEEIRQNLTGTSSWYTTLRPRPVPYISYPYEWSFDMLKDAALLTLKLARESMTFGMMLRDATPFNIQWTNGRPTFIDTLSFEQYDPSSPWIAYRQFSEGFLSPLLLMHHTGEPLQKLMLAYPEGIPLPLTASLLPWKSRLSLYTFLHVHLQANLSKAMKKNGPVVKKVFSGKKMDHLLGSLESLVLSLRRKRGHTTWENYYEESTDTAYLESKKSIISNWLNESGPIRTALDLGANRGEFSFLTASRDIQTVAIDSDHGAINNLYLQIKKDQKGPILPLVIDLSNPSPALGLNNRERASFISRARADLVLALALVHHLSIGRNIPFEHIATLLRDLGTRAIVEFIPKDDEKIRLMLSGKKDIYHDYTEAHFIKALEAHFTMVRRQEIGDSGRILFFLERHA